MSRPFALPGLAALVSAVVAALVSFAAPAAAQDQDVSMVRLADVQMRDASVLPDEETGYYYIISSGRRATVRAYRSRDLVEWEGPYTVFETPQEMWGEDVNIRGIWAPEIHKYNGRYFIFLTFDSDYELPEQWDEWIEWRPRVRRASQIVWSDDPLGPYQPFSMEPTLPAEMMTLDGTLWVEGGQPYMVYSHEWVQIVDGAMGYAPLADDLSQLTGPVTTLFRASEAPWNIRSVREGIWVTDGPWLYRSPVSDKLFMLWSSFSETGYTTGIAESESGTLAGPWIQQEEAIYTDDGGHPMLFTTFDGRLMMALHSPNGGPLTRIHLFEMEDTGETLRIVEEYIPE